MRRERPGGSTLEQSLERNSEPKKRARREVGKECEVAHILEVKAVAISQAARIDPPLRSLIDAFQDREQIAHVKPEELIAWIAFVHEQHPARAKHAGDLAQRLCLGLAAGQVMQDPDDEHEVDGAVANGEAERVIGDDGCVAVSSLHEKSHRGFDADDLKPAAPHFGGLETKSASEVD